MTPKQFIKYTRWLDKKGLAFCDGSTMEPQNLLDIIQTIIILFGITGLFGVVYYKFRGGSNWF